MCDTLRLISGCENSVAEMVGARFMPPPPAHISLTVVVDAVVVSLLIDDEEALLANISAMRS